jgi:spermidine synthase
MGAQGNPVSEFERETKQILTAVTLCFFFSGTTGLIYEVLWTRILGLVFGHTVFAITTVLAAFMAGLGLGSYLFGGIADRNGRPLRLYGFLEAGIGIYALITPYLFSRAESIYILLHRALGLSFFAFSLSQFLLLFLILLIPTTLMGATLPVLSRFFVRGIEILGGQVGRLYALNTFGAVLGTYAAGFHLIPTLGVRTTLLLAAITNIGIGVLTFALDRHLLQLAGETSASQAVATVSPRTTATVGGPPDRRWAAAVWLTVVGLGVSGAASMIYEVAWTRTLSLIIGSSTYAFSTMLVTFLAGLALGSYLYSRCAGHIQVTPVVFGCLQLGIGLSALLVTPFFDRMPEVFLQIFQLSQSPGFVKTIQFFISALAMFVPTLFMGATFPCAIQIASTQMSRLGRDIGRVYSVNTGGAIAGTVLAGFLLIPLWGLQPALKLAVALNLCLALALFVTSRWAGWRRGAAVLASMLALAASYASPTWDPSAMTSGVAIYGRSYFGRLSKVGFRAAAAFGDRLLYYRDGLSATVSVHQQGDLLYLRVNGKTDASNTGDMHTQLMMGHLPLLIHPDPKRVLVVGMGSGVTAGAVALYPTERIDVIEIEPAVVEAAEFFTKENRGILKNPKAHVAIADGRNFLLASDGGYDVIISEPSNPWMRGIGNLFSLDFYELAAQRLAAKGIVCQWIHTYGLFPEDLKMVVKTFRAVFPHTTIWNTTRGDLILLGSKEPWTLDHARLQARFGAIPGLREDLARLGIPSPLALLADFVLVEEDAAQYSQHAVLNTDDLPFLEFSAPDSLYSDTVDLNLRVLKSFERRPFPTIVGLPEDALTSAEFRRDLGLAFWANGRMEDALSQFDKALQSNPRDVVSLLHRGRVRLRSGAVLLAEADWKAVLRLDPNLPEAHEALAQLYKTQGMLDLAEAHLRENVVLLPKDPRPRVGLADLLREQRRFDEAIQHYRVALAFASKDGRLWSGLGLAYQGAGRGAEALEAFRQAVSIDPESAFAQYNLGQASLEAKRLDEALAALRAASLKDPFRAEVFLALGRLHTARGDKTEALRAYLHCLRLDPLNTPALKAVEELSTSLEGSGSSPQIQE